jgi:outer membrane protein OmpA-like peptidoglycan-associated protein
MTLSQQRATSVRSYLISQGTQAVRINAIGMGETQPIADNSTAEGRAANRRVEIILTPITQ